MNLGISSRFASGDLLRSGCQGSGIRLATWTGACLRCRWYEPKAVAEFPDMRVRDREGLARIFRYFGEVETPRLGSAVYTVFSLGVASDPEMLDLVARVDPDQPPPNILYAGVHDLLLRDAAEGLDPDPLASWYPSVSGAAIPEVSPWQAFRHFCLENRARLAPILETGRTQTCVVHRCAVILPAFACLPRVEAQAGRVALLEIGPSAGLNLRLDCYRYEYGDGHGWGDPKAQPVLIVDDRGDSKPPLPERLEVVARRGLDLNPLDPGDPDTVRWLRALIWPEHVERAHAMDAALAHSQSVPIEIIRGDATRDVEREVQALPEDAARVVFATHVFYQISREGRQAIAEGLADASAEQPLDLILMESSGEGDSIVTHFAFEDGRRSASRQLARADSHGRWIDWQER